MKLIELIDENNDSVLVNLNDIVAIYDTPEHSVIVLSTGLQINMNLTAHATLKLIEALSKF